MTTTRKFFVNNTINTTEDIKALVTTFRAFQFVNNERAEALDEMTAIIDEYNAELKKSAIATIINSGDILSAMIPTMTLDEKTAKTNARKRAVLSAISYKVYKVDTIKNEVRATERALTIRDIHSYKCDLIASGHADRKVTKADRERAKNEMLTTEQKNALRLFMMGAYRFENVADLAQNEVYAFRVPSVENTALFLEDKPSRANAEKQIKATATACGLGDINYKRAHALTLYKRAYTIDKGHQVKTADILDFMQDFIIASRYAKNNINLPEVNDRAEIFSTETTADNDDIIKF